MLVLTEAFIFCYDCEKAGARVSNDQLLLDFYCEVVTKSAYVSVFQPVG